MLTTSASSAAG